MKIKGIMQRKKQKNDQECEVSETEWVQVAPTAQVRSSPVLGGRPGSLSAERTEW